ncbi:hypothetical protein JK628_12585 [Shewanella sp. KX20019]|uniref:hypothetical protein n=1 Tax=Shewanella sp. KX20019 TaxID=2803864 RepID=UPI0019291F16|nr:hypothetical protein [Shewanella sp. KX20019]QQX78426.1 hypothetical protein JK628_12585 [Shewanella sp. KX20019]
MKQESRSAVPVFSAVAVGEKELIEPNFSTSLEPANEPVAKINSDKSAISSGHWRTAYSLLLVVLLHIVLIGIINQFWVRQALKVTTVTPIKIQSYLYVQPIPLEETVMENTEAPKSNDASQNHSTGDNRASTEQNKPVDTEVVTAPRAEVNKTLKSELSTNDALETADLRVDDSTPVEAQETVVSKRSVLVNKSNNAMAFAQSYLQRKNDAALDALIVDKANEYTGSRSLSEMDGDMVELIFPEVDEYSKIPTTDHRLDPNRIVRQGDTCFRIVKTPTQINPYAENIGYPFNCGGDKVKKAINDAISARLEKRMSIRQK